MILPFLSCNRYFCMTPTKRYFHTFDAFRSISFILVFLAHLPKPKESVVTFFSKSGSIGVSFFFVLSGFLITYILGFEKLSKNKIELKNFFIRRVLRIWPLFYLMLLFAFLTPHILGVLGLSFSNEGYDPNWLVSLLFGENYMIMSSNCFANVSPLSVMWSLCVEEHFYIVWGLLFYFLPFKKVPILIGISIIIAMITHYIYLDLDIVAYDLPSNIGYFAFGAIPAYLILTENKLLQRIENSPLEVKYLFFFIVVAFVFGIPNYATDFIYGIVPLLLGVSFSGLILFTLTPSNAIYIKDSNWLSWLGKYTYGLYAYHTILINLILQLNNTFSLGLEWYIIGFVALTLTIVVSVLSYNYFEKYFLDLKRQFSS